MATQQEQLHEAFLQFSKRAEKVDQEVLVDAFVDMPPLFSLLKSPNSQVIYGRRGTGKTHLFKYVSSEIADDRNHSAYVDLRTIGSNQSIYNDPAISLSQRAARLTQDVLAHLYEDLVSRLTPHHPKLSDFAEIADDLKTAITEVRVVGKASTEDEESRSSSYERSVDVSAAGTPSVKLQGKRSSADNVRSKIVLEGQQSAYVHVGRIQTALSAMLQFMDIGRYWLFIDEWSEIPIELQPYLADAIRRVVLPNNAIIVKIAAIEHRTRFIIKSSSREYVGLELGADISADLNLDDFLVFGNNSDKATKFFRDLLFRHCRISDSKIGLLSPTVITSAFTQKPAFEEFVRASEGVPRDALNLASMLATKNFGQTLSVPMIRTAARDWYQADKHASIAEDHDLADFLQHIIDEVIRGRRARAFMLKTNTRDDRIETLFDARIIHVLKRNVSTHDEPGARFNVFSLDYGCYVDLMNTQHAPVGLFEADGSMIEVPRDDYRSIRRAVLKI